MAGPRIRRLLPPRRASFASDRPRRHSSRDEAVDARNVETREGRMIRASAVTFLSDTLRSASFDSRKLIALVQPGKPRSVRLRAAMFDRGCFASQHATVSSTRQVSYHLSSPAQWAAVPAKHLHESWLDYLYWDTEHRAVGATTFHWSLSCPTRWQSVAACESVRPLHTGESLRRGAAAQQAPRPQVHPTRNSSKTWSPPARILAIRACSTAGATYPFGTTRSQPLFDGARGRGPTRYRQDIIDSILIAGLSTHMVCRCQRFSPSVTSTARSTSRAPT